MKSLEDTLAALEEDAPCADVDLVFRFPDPREDLESRSPNLGPYTTKGTL